MTKDKALKRDVRSRMTKTGESYTTARHFLLDEHETDVVSEPVSATAVETAPESKAASPPTLLPRIADPGMSDEAIQKSTGRTWDEWFIALDAWGATEHNHTEIARYVATEFGLGGWWAQNVTVGYERARGMRKVNEHIDGYSVNASWTFRVPVDRVYRAFAGDAERGRWLAPDLIKVRTFTENKVWRCEIVENRSRVEVRFTIKSPEQTSIAIEHAKLPAEEDVTTWRAFWREHLNRLTEALA